MRLKLSSSDWNELWQEENREAIDPSSCADQVWKFSGQLGRGREQYTPLRNGLHLIVDDYELWEDITIDSQYCDETYPGHPCINFVVSGTVRTIHHGITDYVFEVPGKNHLEFVREGRETEDWSAGEPDQSSSWHQD